LLQAGVCGEGGRGGQRESCCALGRYFGGIDWSLACLYLIELNLSPSGSTHSLFNNLQSFCLKASESHQDELTKPAPCLVPLFQQNL
jgi:hypothetical protein